MVWKRILLPESKKKEEQQKERKASKTMEDFGTGIVDQRRKKEQIAAFDQIHWNDDEKDEQTGFAAFLADLTKTTGGIEGLLTPKARAGMAWLIAQGQQALEDEDTETMKLVKKWSYEWFSLLAPLQPERPGPDIVLMPYATRPGGNQPPQNAGP